LPRVVSDAWIRFESAAAALAAALGVSSDRMLFLFR
jgi:hypothetical protein